MDALKSLTPETFNAIILAALGLSLALGGWRFYKDMQRQPRPENDDELYLADMRLFYKQNEDVIALSQDKPRS
jgi:hypothetical protein